MTIITISRGSASGGLMLARGLAERFGFEILSREEIVREACRFGVSEDKLRAALLKPLGFWDRFKHERRRYLAFIQAVLCEHMRRDNIVYHGNAGHLLLRGVSHVFRLRLIAPLSFRIEQLAEREGMGPEEAEAYIEKVDRQRRDWTHFLYGLDYLDPGLYDLTINLENITVESAVDLAADAASRKEFAATGESRRELDDLVLASRVRAALAADERTAMAEPEVRARDGVIFLKGKCRTPSLVPLVIEVAKQVEGVRDVDRRDLDAPELLV